MIGQGNYFDFGFTTLKFETYMYVLVKVTWFPVANLYDHLRMAASPISRHATRGVSF